MHYDLIIVGGGLVGRSIACALRHSALRIALIDAKPYEQADPRLIALNYGSFSFLNKIGIWPHLEPHSAPIHEVHVSHRGRFGATRMTGKALDLPALGYVVPAQAINQALGNTLLTVEPFTELRPATVTNVQLGEKTTLTIDTQQQLSADVVIAADGTHSTLRKLLHFDTQITDYHQSALVTTTHLHRSHRFIAYERFLEDGALAMLPLQGTDWQCATIWTANTAKVSSLMQQKTKDFLSTLQAEFGYRLGRFKSVSARHVFPLQFIHVKNPSKGNVILIGNAAHTIHPVGAQGLNLALYEIAHLTQQLINNIEKNQPLIQDLTPKLQKTNLYLSHYLTPLFSSRAWGLNIARQIGMIGLDLCPPLKNKCSRLLAMESVKWL